MATKPSKQIAVKITQIGVSRCFTTTEHDKKPTNQVSYKVYIQHSDLYFLYKHPAPQQMFGLLLLTNLHALTMSQWQHAINIQSE